MEGPKPQEPTQSGVGEAVKHLNEAAAARKCWHCGCLHGSLRAIEIAYPAGTRSEALASIVEVAHTRLREVKYDCLGCEVCWPALAINALGVEGEACASEPASAREGWPPLPGAYHVLRYHAPVAVCTLTDQSLSRTVAAVAGAEIALVGTMQTENLGIERLMQNALANPNLRFVVLCGADSRQAIGHLPGQSLVALARAGVDERMRIIGAGGKRPLLRNVNPEVVEHFRHTVEIVDRIGETSVPRILDTAKSCAARNPGPAEPFAGTRTVATIGGYLPERMISDPAGYFVVFPDCGRGLLMLEHYRNDGVLDVVIEGQSPGELYIPAIEKGLVSRLDHAAYLGKELARAEEALLKGGSYVQDAAPELQTPLRVVNERLTEVSACACHSCCGEDKHA
jgi:tetrahydromethanopterin S-methyltransferase subunit A